MRRLLFYIICFFCASIMDAQKITIAQCECLPLDLSASINPREDLNGDKCALLKVEMATEKATFEGNILGKVEYKVNEYWVSLVSTKND